MAHSAQSRQRGAGGQLDAAGTYCTTRCRVVILTWLQGGNSNLIRTRHCHHQKHWQTEVGQKRAGSAASLPAAPSGPLGLGKPPGELRSQHQGASPWKGTKEAGRGRQGTSVAFSFLEDPSSRKGFSCLFTGASYTVTDRNPLPSCSSSFLVNLSPKYNYNNTEAFFSCGSQHPFDINLDVSKLFSCLPPHIGTHIVWKTCDTTHTHTYMHTHIHLQSFVKPRLSPIIQCLWNVGHIVEKF